MLDDLPSVSPSVGLDLNAFHRPASRPHFLVTASTSSSVPWTTTSLRAAAGGASTFFSGPPVWTRGISAPQPEGDLRVSIACLAARALPTEDARLPPRAACVRAASAGSTCAESAMDMCRALRAVAPRRVGMVVEPSFLVVRWFGFWRFERFAAPAPDWWQLVVTKRGFLTRREGLKLPKALFCWQRLHSHDCGSAPPRLKKRKGAAGIAPRRTV